MTYRFICGAAIIAATACANPQTETSANFEAVTGEPIQIEQIPASLPVAGTVKAGRRAEISTRLMARVSDMRVDVGQAVREGQLLAIIGRDDLAASLDAARAAVSAAEAARDEARRQVQRMETLLEQDAVPVVQRDGARLQSVQAESGYSMAAANLAQVEAQMGYSELRAPFAGRIVQRSVDAGDVAAPGVPLLVLEDRSREGVAHVPAEILPSLNIGTELSIKDANGFATASAITRIASGADRATGTVEIRFALGDEWLTGSAITVLVPQGVHEGVAVHENAITRRGQLTGVRVATDAGIQTRWIRLGKSYIGHDSIVHFEVLSGLRTGERIVQ